MKAGIYPQIRSCVCPGGGGIATFETKFHLLRKAPILLLLAFITFSKGEAQSTTSFFYPSSVTVNNLSSSQENRRQKLLAMPIAKSVQLVQINNLFPLLSSDLLPIILPNTTKTFTFATHYIRTYPNGDYTWSGELSSTEYCEDGITENDCFDGSFMTMKKDGHTYSELWFDTSYYQIRDLGEGVSALVEIDNTEIQEGCATPSDTPFSGGGGEQNAAERDDPPLCPVRVLILHTQAALDANPDIIALANAGFSSTKIALARSKVTENQLSITLAGIQPLTTIEWAKSGGPINTDIATLSTNDATTDFRTQYNADLVFILTAGGYTNATGAIVTFGDAVIDGATAFAIVEANAITAPQYTFAHEFGHLLGARHEGTDLCAADDDDSGLPDAHGYRFHKLCNCLIVQRKDYYTLMSTRCRNGSAKRIHNYSNPDVEYHNKNTGRVDKNNNAKILRDATCRISNYVVSNEVFVQIEGEDHTCPFMPVTLQAIVSGDEPISAYTFKWESSYDGNTWFDISQGTGLFFSTYTVLASGTSGVILHIRVTITTPSGAMDHAWHEVKSILDNSCPQRPSRSRFDSGSDKTVAVFPNPNTGEMTLIINDAKENNIGISLINPLGQTLFSQPDIFSEGDHFQSKIGMPNLPEGTYWLKVQNGEKLSFKKIFIVK